MDEIKEDGQMIDYSKMETPHNSSFQRYVLSMKETLSRELLEDFPMAARNAEISSCPEFISSHLVVQLRTWLLQKYHEQGKVRVYDSFLEHFKDRFFPKWAKDKWPPKTTEYTISKSWVCPHANYKWPERGDIHIKWMVSKDESR